MLVITYEITTLQNEARVFAARFWRNFYRAMLTHGVRSAMTKLLAVALAVFLLAHGRAGAQNRTTLVVAVDLTQSVAVAGLDGKTEFQKNLDAVTKLLAQVPADSRVTIIGITDKSFVQPDILLSAAIPSDAGYFSERLNSARSELIHAWKARSSRLKPEYRSTDIIGVLLVASQIFGQHSDANNKMLVIFSDMRHRTPDLDIESPLQVPSISLVRRKSDISFADLHGVHVRVLGVDGAGKQIAYWQSLRQFWTDYFRTSGASLESYTVLREQLKLDRR
jgi:hypothetical protein